MGFINYLQTIKNMAKTKKKITCTAEIELSYNENSKAFKEGFESYKKHIYDGAVEDFLTHICHNMLHFGSDVWVDGVGHVKHKKQKLSEVRTPYAGVELLSDPFWDFDYEVE
jgi:hypothetical protein